MYVNAIVHCCLGPLFDPANICSPLIRTHHGLERDVALLDERRLALLLRHRCVVRDVGHVALLLVAVGAFDGPVVYGLFNLNKAIIIIRHELTSFNCRSLLFEKKVHV